MSVCLLSGLRNARCCECEEVDLWSRAGVGGQRRRAGRGGSHGYGWPGREQRQPAAATWLHILTPASHQATSSPLLLLLLQHEI